MTCVDIQKMLSAYVDRQLPAWEKTDVMEHLETCEACRQELNALVDVKQQLRSYSLPAMPAIVRSKIEAETFRKSSSAWSWRTVVRRSSPAGLSRVGGWWVPALAFAAAAGAWMFAQHAKTRPDPVPQIIAAAPAPLPASTTAQVAWHREARPLSDKPQ